MSDIDFDIGYMWICRIS